MITTTLQSANLLVAMAGLATVSGPLALAGAVVSGALSAHDLVKSLPNSTRSLVGKVDATLKSALENSHASEETKSLILQMIEHSIPTPETIVAAGKDPARILDEMEQVLDRHPDPALAPAHLRQHFRDALTPALHLLMQDDGVARALQAAFQTEVLQQLQAQNDRLSTLIEGMGDKARELRLTEQLFIGLAKRVSIEINDIDSAHRQLESLVERAAHMAEQAKLPSNPGAQVDAVTAEVARLNALDDLDGGQNVIAQALAEADAHKARLLGLAVEQSLLRLDAEGAAKMLIVRADIDAGGQAAFDDLRELQNEWHEHGRDKGIRLDLEVSVALAKAILERALGWQARGTALNDLGIALAEIGQQSGVVSYFEDAITIYSEALQERTRERAPLEWATTQNNLGAALLLIAEQRDDTNLVQQAIDAYREALKERTRDNGPLEWATAQNNLGSALLILAKQNGVAETMHQAITAYRQALKVWAQDRVPHHWAAAQNNLGNALSSLAEQCADAELKQEAITAYREALKEWTRDRVPLNWATAQCNLGSVLKALAERNGDANLLQQAIVAYTEALKERPRERVPLDWAKTHGNLADAERVRFDLSHDATHLDKAQVHLDAAREVFEAHGATGYLAIADTIQAEITARRP